MFPMQKNLRFVFPFLTLNAGLTVKESQKERFISKCCEPDIVKYFINFMSYYNY
jgi:hypothetical protein